MTLDSWDDIAAFALSLPGTEAATSWGQPAIKVRGKLICSTGRQPGSFHASASHDEKALLLETDPDTFWQTAHYANWPGLLVHYGSRDAERVRAVIARAWWDRTTRTARQAYGPRP